MRLLPLLSILLTLPVGAEAGPERKAAAPAPAVASLAVQPAAVSLLGQDAEQALLVSGMVAGGAARDLTRAAVYRSSNPKVAQVTKQGLVRIAGDGKAVIEVRAGGKTARVAVTARDAARPRPIGFTRDVLPVLTKSGCNQAACHAKQGGKGGFQLSVFAYDPEADHAAIVRQAGGRRLNRLDPARSLLLLKPTMALPHGGGLRFKPGSPEYRLIARWLAAGSPLNVAGEAPLVRVEVEPKERVVGVRQAQQMLATAVYSDGSRRDVTRLAEYKSNESDVAEADGNGLVSTRDFTGEAAVMLRYMGQMAVTRVTVPMPKAVPAAAFAALPRQNFVDDLVYRKLAQLNLLPSPQCDDATFLRRASLDLIGTLPTAEETRAFLAECEAERKEMGKRGNEEMVRTSSPPFPHFPISSFPAPKARKRLVDRLLARPEYADYWGMRWVNLLLVDRDPLFPKGAWAYDRWVRDAFRRNMPYDEFAREIVTATGETYHDGPANFYRSLTAPEERGKAISQLFLGVRLDCAQCHHHPFERWGQQDFYGMAAFFARVRQKGASEFERVIYNGTDGDVQHPKTGKVVPPQPLAGEPVKDEDDVDRREVLARWMTAPENPFFARTVVNRLWGMLMGRGLVEPVDDLRLTNPASNEPLLEALAKDFGEHRYDLKHLLGTIALSAAYQRSSVATRDNARDTRNYSRFLVKRLPAEVLLDMVGQVTGVPETYQGHPAGMRAIQLWDNKLPVEFLNVFGRPSRLSVCECDRPADGSVTEILHLMNAPSIQNRLTDDDGTAAKLDKAGRPPEAVIEELYLTIYNRPPTAEEVERAKGAFTRTGATRRSAIEDLVWVLMNTPEFVFNH